MGFGAISPVRARVRYQQATDGNLPGAIVLIWNWLPIQKEDEDDLQDVLQEGAPRVGTISPVHARVRHNQAAESMVSVPC